MPRQTRTAEGEATHDPFDPHGAGDRRFVAVDRERGIVFAFAFFDHRPIHWTWELGELFKIDKGLIRRIETIFIRAPYGMNSGWSTYEQNQSEEIQDVR